MKRISIVLCILLALTVTGCGKQAPEHKQVILITVDNLRPDVLSVYEDTEAQTPAIKKFAADSVVFENAYTPYPDVVPAYASLMTGVYPPVHGLRASGICKISNSRETLAGVFQNNGFFTKGFPATDLPHPDTGLARGFQNYELSDLGRKRITGIRQKPAKENLADAAEWVQTVASSDFFLWVNLGDLTFPYSCDDCKNLSPKNRYIKNVESIDSELKKFFESLKNTGVYDNARIVFTSSNGEAFGEHDVGRHGLFLYEEDVRIPLIYKDPLLNSGKRSNTLTSLIDIFPTLIDSADIEFSDLPGVNLADSLKKEKDRTLYMETYIPNVKFKWSPLKGLITPDYKYIRDGGTEVYDISKDPSEKNNIARTDENLKEKLESKFETVSGNLPNNENYIEMDHEKKEKLRSRGFQLFNIEESHETSPTERTGTYKKLNRALSLLRSKKRKAADILEELRKDNPDNPYIAYVEGKILSRGKKSIDKSIKLLQSIPEEASEYLEAQHQLGHIYMRKGNYKEAKKTFKTCLELNSKREDITYDISCAYSILGEIGKSKNHLKRSVKLGFRDYPHIKTDPDLKRLKESINFDDYIKDLKKEYPQSDTSSARQ